ncbi:coiled-coil domain-containing protein SCD2-like [Arachis duranensis]|uniref:Coiled-coil domain-containing protein SCD2-like n=1 Tax=Arachis duranensis TaxID=130453 RepID=A0A6P5M7S7_ARADU|nr:coiled-coil domain-containing protein SCD2-like [Arachis duranensis]
MDRRRSYERQQSSTPTTPTSPSSGTPQNLHARAGSTGSVMANPRRVQNIAATKAAAQRLAQVMSHSTVDVDDEDEEEVSLDYSTLSVGIGLGAARPARPHSPMRVPAIPEQPSSSRSRSPLSVRIVQERPQSLRSISSATGATIDAAE